MMGNLTPFVVNGPPTTNTNTINFTGGPWTYIRTRVDSSAETLATWRLDEDTSSKIEFLNRSSSNTVFAPGMQFTGSATAPTTTFGGAIDTRIQSDSGAIAAHLFHVQTVAGAAIATRTLWTWRNNNNTVLDFLPLNSGANGALSWGTQGVAAPSLASRSIGTRAVWYNSVSGVTSDFSTGVNSGTLWNCVPEATTSYKHSWYAGATHLGFMRGDGAFSLGTNTIAYLRLGQKLETNTSANYGGAALNTWSATAAESSILDLNRSKSATIGTHTVVANNDGIGGFYFRGSDGTAFINTAMIRCEVDGTPGTNDMPGRLLFGTTPDGSAGVIERMRITNAGDVGVGKTPTTGIILDVNGQLGLKSYTVATLPSASVQAGAIVYASDAGGNGPCLVISNGTNWKRCDNTSTTVS